MSTSDRCAVVTGASSGIGLELARELVNRGYKVVMAAEDAGIHTAASGLGGETVACQVDLATAEGIDKLWAHVTGLGQSMDVICINAGVGVGGPFVETKIADEINMVNLNVAGTLYLAKRAAIDMATRGTGRILFTSSVASQMPGPFYAVYAATKSFVQSFSEALREELAEKGVVVTALMPGPTDTRFFARADLTDTVAGQGAKDDPAEVARQGLDALFDGKDSVVTVGLKNKAQVASSKLMSDKAKAKIHRKQIEPNSHKH